MDATLTARDRYRETVAEALGDWRRYCSTVKSSASAESEIIKLGIGEIAALRLQEAYAPVLGVLTAIEEKLFRLTKACSYDHMDKWRGRPTDEPLFVGSASADFVPGYHRDILSVLEQAARWG